MGKRRKAKGKAKETQTTNINQQKEGLTMPVSDPKLQATYALLPNPFPFRSQLWRERDQEIRHFAQLATWSELAVTKEEYQLYSNGVKVRCPNV